MINAEELYTGIFSDSRITNLVPDENIFNAYPGDVEDFPCIAYIDENQNDTEYRDNKPGASGCALEVHIFSKKLEGYVSTADIAVAIAEVMNEKLWHCSQNRGGLPDLSPDVDHRVMRFSKSILRN